MIVIVMATECVSGTFSYGGIIPPLLRGGGLNEWGKNPSVCRLYVEQLHTG